MVSSLNKLQVLQCCLIVMGKCSWEEWYGHPNREGHYLLSIAGRNKLLLQPWCLNDLDQIKLHCSPFIMTYPHCPKCNITQATPAHVVTCIGCQRCYLYSSPAPVLHCLKLYVYRLHLIKWNQKERLIRKF